MKGGVLVFILIMLVLGGVVYTIIVHNYSWRVSYTNTVSTSPTEAESDTSTKTESRYMYPRFLQINNATFIYDERYSALASEKFNISEVVEALMIYSPSDSVLEFHIAVSNNSRFYEQLWSIWNNTAIIFAEPAPGIVAGPYGFIEGPLPLDDIYRALIGPIAYVGIWETSVSIPVRPKLVEIADILETDGSRIHVDLSYYTRILKDKERANETVSTPLIDLGKWSTTINGTKADVHVFARFDLPFLCTAHLSPDIYPNIHPSDFQSIIPLFWYRDPCFYNIILPGIRFVADFLGLDYRGRAMLVKNMFGSLSTADSNMISFADVLVNGGSCREFAFYSMVLARALGISRVYMLAVSPGSGGSGWVIAPSIAGHALSVTDDPSIGDANHRLVINGKTYYVFVDNGWALRHWDEFISMARNSRAYLMYPNPRYVGNLSLTDIAFSKFLRDLDGWCPASYITDKPVAVLLNETTLVLVYNIDEEQSPRAFTESIWWESDYMDRFNLSIPLYNVSSSYTVAIFKRWLKWAREDPGHYTIKMDNETSPSYIEIFTGTTVCNYVNLTCYPGWRLLAGYYKAKLKNGLYESMKLCPSTAFVYNKYLYRIVLEIPMQITEVSIS